MNVLSKSRGSRQVNTVVILVHSDPEWRKKEKDYNEKIGYPVVDTSNPFEAMHLIQFQFELYFVILVTGSTITFRMDENSEKEDVYSGIELIKYFGSEEKRIFPIVSIFVHDEYDDVLFGEAEAAGAYKCFSRGQSDAWPEGNLGAYFRESIFGAERLLLLKHMLNLDPLTSDLERGIYIYNRMGAFARWRHTWREAKKSNLLPACAFIDLNGFGEANVETHDDGDRLIKEIAMAMCTHLRPSDYLLRYGGDEFLLFLPETNEFQAKAALNHLQKDLARTSFKLRSGAPFQVSFTSGVSTPSLRDLGLEADVAYKRQVDWANSLERKKKALKNRASKST